MLHALLNYWTCRLLTNRYFSRCQGIKKAERIRKRRWHQSQGNAPPKRTFWVKAWWSQHKSYQSRWLQRYSGSWFFVSWNLLEQSTQPIWRYVDEDDWSRNHEWPANRRQEFWGKEPRDWWRTSSGEQPITNRGVDECVANMEETDLCQSRDQRESARESGARKG